MRKQHRLLIHDDYTEKTVER